MRGIRGATQVAANTRAAIEEAVVELCQELTRRNRLAPDRIVWAIFTVTHDLDADFPARGARAQGWQDVPMICSQEIPVPGSMARVVRVLVHVDGERPPHHVYLRGAQALRPDLHHGAPARTSRAPARPRPRARAGAGAGTGGRRKPRP